MDAYDAVVVGGGIVGSSVAYHLARGGSRTLLADREDEGRATDAGAGIVSPLTSSRSRDPDWLEFATGAADYYPELADRLDDEGAGPTGFDRPGLLAVAVDEGEVPEYERSLEAIRSRRDRLDDGPEIEEIGPDNAASEFPPLGDAVRAFRYPDAGRVEGRRFAAALRDAGRSHGLETVEADVTEIRIDGRVTGVRTADRRTIPTETVVVAGGAWSPAFADQLEISLPISPQRGQIVHLGLPSGSSEPEEWPIVKAFRDHYMVPWPDGRVAAGATRETGSGFAPRTTAAGVREVLEEALRVAPGLADAALEEVRVGLRPASPDGRPVLGAVPDVPGAFLATGHGPTGLTFGPYSGKLVADRVRGESRGLEAFSVDRFEE
ncbi:NAD(P)/FAD-dependent oxidoreductase [Saliphagus infecundisoli]|uniref:NAD(P)/FAD-dependent oxidoreductase n=1 Tax=Saliphagus infecundisoli TaxID=1849069 RepID=A0ABD5Q9N8_9EURY|nr:FAD-dependent oxidoreductase [Saliphagus infecundisoli]